MLRAANRTRLQHTGIRSRSWLVEIAVNSCRAGQVSPFPGHTISPGRAQSATQGNRKSTTNDAWHRTGLLLGRSEALGSSPWAAPAWTAEEVPFVAVATDEAGTPVPASDLFGALTVAPLPEGTAIEAAFLLIKLSDGDWCARSVGVGYNRVEMLGQLTAYTHSLTQDEARGWLTDDDPET